MNRRIESEADMLKFGSVLAAVLEPGDVISTGTPAGVGLGFNPPQYLKPGDVVELGIDSLGSSSQTCVEWSK